MMKGLSSLAVASLAIFGLAGCDDDDDNNVSTRSVSQTSLQAVHASSDAPKANVIVNGTEALSGVDYGVGSGYLMIDAGMTDVKVDIQLPGGATQTVVDLMDLELMEDMKYTAFVVGDADADPNPVSPLLVARDAVGMATSTTLDVQIVHAASGVGVVDVYVTEPGVDLSTVSPLAGLDFKQSTDVVNVEAKDYQVRLVAGGNVAFDSGTIPLPGNAELTIAAINTADSNSASPVKLIVLDGNGSSIIEDTNAKAEVRVGHLVDGAPTVDVFVNDAAFAPLADLEFKQIRGYLDLDAGDYNLKVFQDGTTTGTLIDADAGLMAGTDYSIYAVGTVTPAPALEPLVVADVRRAVATSAVLNVTHAASAAIAAEVDVYLTASTNIDGSDPALPNFAYKATEPNIYVGAGDYFVTVTVAGDPNTVAIPATPVTLANGFVYQVVAIDDAGGFNLLVNDITD